MDNAVNKLPCTCEYKRSLAEKMLKMRESIQDAGTDWVDLLLPNHNPADIDVYCCLLAAMFYYGYCEKCTVSVTEYARDMLGHLMIHHPDCCKPVK